MTTSDTCSDSPRAVAAATASGQSKSRSVARRLLPYLIAAVVSVAILVPTWHLNKIDWTVPLGIVGDHNIAQATVANLVRDGHFNVNPLLGAPGQQELYDYPSPYWVHILLIRLLGIFIHNPGLAINLFFFLTYPLVAISAVFAFRRLGIPAGLAVAGGVLYSFIPFHQLRNEVHLLFSAYYVVPLLALMLVWVSVGHPLFRFRRRDDTATGPRITRDGILSLIICVLVAWDTPYCLFFGFTLLISAALLGWLRHKDGTSILTAVVLASVMVISFGIEMVPNYVYIRNHGRTAVAERIPSESQIYGLTLIQMLAPVTNHRVPALAKWKEQFRSHSILVNENDTASLGLVGAVGCIVLFLCLFWPKCSEVLYSLSVLNLSAFLLGTIGGLGAVFSFVISPQLRGFNRVSVFISFFCLAGLLLLLDSFLAQRLGDGGTVIRGFVLPAILIVVGVYDQVPRGLMLGRDQIEKQYREDADFIHRIESMVPPRSMILELPFDPFPESPPVNQMGDYEELRGYLHSRSLRWSYGAMKGRPASNWLAAISSEPTDRMLSATVTAGFAGILIDRFGYADRAAGLESQLTSLLGAGPIVNKSGRLSFFLLDKAAADSLKGRLQPGNQLNAEQSADPLVMEIAGGCWQKEGTDTDNWHWCGKKGEIEILNPSTSPRKIALEATFATVYPEFSTLDIDRTNGHQQLKINSQGQGWKAELTVPPGLSSIALTSEDTKRVSAPADPREMYFRINNFRVHVLSSPSTP